MVREISGEERMLRIQRSENGEVIFTLSGQMDEEPIAELERLINSERNGRRIVLDLKDLTLVNENAITFLERCESSRITLENCPPYIREWIKRQRRES
jgi:anti-anti-sigma regulatory factor